VLRIQIQGLFDPGSGDFLTPDPGSGIGFFRIPDPKPIFWEINDNFLGKKVFLILCKLAQIFFFTSSKIK
jgi:hypothetical protein